MTKEEKSTPVLVVGSGPTGLTLAHELALAGVRPVIIDRMPSPNEHSKALGLQPRTVEILAMRGLLQSFSTGRSRRCPTRTSPDCRR